MTSNTSSAALRPQFTHCLLFFLHSKSKLALWHFTCLSWPSFWITHLVSMVASMTFHKLIPSSHRHLRPWLPVTTARTRTEARVILEPLNRVPTTLWPRPPRLLWRRLPRLLCRCRLMRTRPRSCCCVFCTCSRTWSQVRKTRAKILVLPTKVSNVLPSSDAQMPYRLSVSFNSFASLSGVILDWWRQILTGVVKRPHWHFTVLSYIQDQHMSKFAAVIDVFDLLEWVKHFFSALCLAFEFTFVSLCLLCMLLLLALMLVFLCFVLVLVSRVRYFPLLHSSWSVYPHYVRACLRSIVWHASLCSDRHLFRSDARPLWLLKLSWHSRGCVPCRLSLKHFQYKGKDKIEAHR